jgi:hypothetical protein
MTTRTTSRQKPQAAEDDAAATAAAGTAKEAAQAAADNTTEEVASSADSAAYMAMVGHTEAVKAAGSRGRAVLNGMAKMQEEITSFVSKRIQHDLEAQQEIFRCRNFDELQAVQSRFFRTTMEHYSDETQRLMQLGSEVVQRSVNRGA